MELLPRYTRGVETEYSFQLKPVDGVECLVQERKMLFGDGLNAHVSHNHTSGYYEVALAYPDGRILQTHIEPSTRSFIETAWEPGSYCFSSKEYGTEWIGPTIERIKKLLLDPGIPFDSSEANIFGRQYSA